MSLPRSFSIAAAALAAAWPLLTPLQANSLESTPLRARVPSHGAPLQMIPATLSGVNQTNLFDDPRMWGQRFRELTLGAVETGIAVADFNGDGRLDIYAVSKNGPCALYIQTGDWTFEDQAQKAGVTGVTPGILPSNTGVSVTDINQDGRPDLYLCRYDLPNLLYINQGNGTFIEAAEAAGLAVKDASVHAVWADYDRDGDVDVYLVTNILDFSKAPQGRRDFLFRNEGNGKFADVSKAAGIWGLTQGHTALWSDLNQDGWPDIYVANDFETPDRFYINRGDGTFTDVIDERLPHVTYFSMGADAGDINNDGLVDLFITDMRDRNHREFMAGMEEISRGLWEQERVSKLIPQYMWNAVYVNSGQDRFLEAAFLTGLEATGWTWSARLLDLDTDGRLDAFVTAGMVRNFIDADLVDKQRLAPDLNARALVWKNSAERRETPMVFRNEGHLAFTDVSTAWGMTEATVSFGCAAADFDGDGDLDLVYSNYGAPPTLVRNDTHTGHRAVFRLKGQAPNLQALGTEIVVESASGRQIRQVFTERGMTASEPGDQFFGLGNDKSIKSVTVRWPRGQVQTFTDLPVDELFVIQEPAVETVTLPPARLHATPAPDAWVKAAEGNAGISYTHTLKPFDELSRQRLLPRRLNHQSPALASADVNRDEIADLYIAGTADQAGQLLLGTADGGFSPAESQPWAEQKAAAHVGAAFFDLNQDGAPDLYLAAGGVDPSRPSELLDDRIYLNDGQGRFNEVTNGVPRDGEATHAIAVGRLTKEGGAALFVGGRHRPGAYPQVPRSFLFESQKGQLVDVTDSLAPQLRQIGMVTAAQWADIDRDGDQDLVVATEWGPVSLHLNEGGRLNDVSSRVGLSQRLGWWSALTISDLNGDGRLDLVVGNVGLNTKYRASLEEPTFLFAGDFDGNGRQQLLEAQYEEGRLVPLRGRSKLAYAFPWITKKVPTYRAFAQASLEELFGADKLARGSKLYANELQSGIYIQDTDGKFSFSPLPREAQMAPIQAVQSVDLNNDGTLDLVVVGNHFGPEPTTGRFDGAQGWVLQGLGQGRFTPLLSSQSGFYVPGDSRQIIVMIHPRTQGVRLITSEVERAVRVFEATAGQR